LWTLISNPTMLYCAFWRTVLFYKKSTAVTTLRHENAQPLCYAWTHTNIRLCLSLLCRPGTMQSLQRLQFTDHLQGRPYFINLTPANLNFCRNWNTDIQSWPSKHKARATLQSRCMLIKQNWLFVLKVSLKETLRKCLWDNDLRCAIHPLTFPASLFRATVNNDYRAGDSKSFLCPRISIVRSTPCSDRWSHPEHTECRARHNARFASCIRAPAGAGQKQCTIRGSISPATQLNIVTSYTPLFLDCKLTSETKREQHSIHNHTVYRWPEWLQSTFSPFLYSEQPQQASYLETSIIQKHAYS
jgi:hypothetical protein